MATSAKKKKDSQSEEVRKMYGRRDLLKGIALAGLGAGVAGLLSGMKISEAAVDTTKPAIVSQFSQIGDASVVVFQDKNGNSYVVDKGVGPQLGELIVKANVITPYGASLGAGTTGAQTQTGGILEAINVISASKGKIFVSSGTFNVSQPISLNSFIKIEGAGMEKTIIQSVSGLNGSIFTSSSTSDLYEVQISNLTINGSGQTAGHGIYYQGRRLFVENVKILNCAQDGIHLVGKPNQTNEPLFPSFNKISNSYIGLCGRYGIYSDASARYVVSPVVQNCNIWLCGETTNGAALYYVGMSEVEVRGLTAWRCGYGLYLQDVIWSKFIDMYMDSHAINFINLVGATSLCGHNLFGHVIFVNNTGTAGTKNYIYLNQQSTGQVQYNKFYEVKEIQGSVAPLAVINTNGANILFNLFKGIAWTSSLTAPIISTPFNQQLEDITDLSTFAISEPNRLTVVQANQNIPAMSVVVFQSANSVVLANASSLSTATGLLGFAPYPINLNQTGIVVLMGKIYGATIGGTPNTGMPVYLDITSGGITVNPPSGRGQVVRLIGSVVDATNRFIFMPDNKWKVNPQGFNITTPAMPTSGTAQSNTFPFPVIVYLYGGTVTQITINGKAVFSSASGISLTGQSFTLNPGDTIAVTYTTAPTWIWYGL